jgi:hypothetical protein
LVDPSTVADGLSEMQADCPGLHPVDDGVAVVLTVPAGVVPDVAGPDDVVTAAAVAGCEPDALLEWLLEPPHPLSDATTASVPLPAIRRRLAAESRSLGDVTGLTMSWP